MSLRRLGLLTLIAACAASGCDLLAPEGTSVRGTVVDAATGEPLAGIDVALVAPYTDFAADGETRADGSFVLVVPDGRDIPFSARGFTLVVSESGFVQQTRAIASGERLAVEIRLVRA